MIDEQVEILVGSNSLIPSISSWLGYNLKINQTSQGNWTYPSTAQCSEKLCLFHRLVGESIAT